MFKKGKVVRSLALASLLASTSLAVLSPITTEATKAPDTVINKVDTLAPTTITSGIEYTDVNGYVQTLEIPSNVAVQLNANSKRIIVKFNGQTKYLDNVKNVTIKNITVSNTVAFQCLNTAETVTVENVNFQRGADFAALKNLKELIIKDSNFGEYCGYSLAVRNSPQLETLIVARTTMKSDFRVYCNRSLATSYVYDSQIDGHAKQLSNKPGYVTNYHDSTFKRSGYLKKVYTEGPSLASAFNINLSDTGEKLGESKFDASTEGKISYKNASGEEKEIPVPGNVFITYIDDRYDGINVKLSNRQQFYIENPRDLTFTNIEFRAPIEFTHRGLRLENLEVNNSRIVGVQVWNSDTLKSLKINGSDVNRTASLVKAYNNKVQDTFSIQNSKMVNVKAMCLPNVKDTVVTHKIWDRSYVTNETGFSMYNTYAHGYVYTQNIGSFDYKLPIYNTRFDDHIASTNTIDGNAIRKSVGHAPEIQGDGWSIEKSSYREEEIVKQLKAIDKEDGDISSQIVVVSNEYEDSAQAGYGDFKVVVAVTDSDGNRVEKEYLLTIL